MASVATTRAIASAASLIVRSTSKSSNKIPSIFIGGIAIAASTVYVTSNTHTSTQCESPLLDDEEKKFFEHFSHHRSLINQYRESWDYTESTEQKTPTQRTWPPNIPSFSSLPTLSYDIQFCDRSPNYRDSTSYCSDLKFRIASAYLDSDSPGKQTEGLGMIRDLAERGHPDSMCAYGKCFMNGVDGAGLEGNPKRGTGWFRRAVEMYGHTEALYELGVTFYTGEGVVEDEDGAVECFRKAAEGGHVGAMYMLGDCLLDGVGVERNRGEALDWLVKAGNGAHRGARSRVLAVLEHEDGSNYGKFTDASRQSLIQEEPLEEEEDQDEKEERELERMLEEKLHWGEVKLGERRYTLGASSPVTIARRRTVVNYSRQK